MRNDWNLFFDGGSISAGGDKLVAQLGKFKSALPESYVKFLRAVESGEEAAAASYFQTAISDLAGYIRELLNGFLASEAFLSVARNLVTALGGPSKPRAAASKPSRYPVEEGNASSLDKAAFLAARLRAGPDGSQRRSSASWPVPTAPT